jgi:hypothetical protein
MRLIICVARLWFRGLNRRWFRGVLLLLFACLWFRRVLFLLYACLWVRGAHLSVVSRGAIVYYLPVCGFAGLTHL